MELGPGCRSDGRSREMYRAITLQTGVLSQASGSAQLKIGQTDVIVAAEIGTPDEDRPDCGRLSFAVECSPVASPAFRGRGGDELSAELARTLERCTAAGPSGRGGGLDLAPLGIVAGKTCWVLHIDALVLNLDGNLLDALSVAVKAALADTRLPRVEVVAGEEPGDEPDYEVDDDPSASTPLEVGGLPIVVTISRVGRACAVDLTREEELCAGAALQMPTVLPPKLRQEVKQAVKYFMDFVPLPDDRPVDRELARASKAVVDIRKLFQRLTADDGLWLCSQFLPLAQALLDVDATQREMPLQDVLRRWWPLLSVASTLEGLAVQVPALALAAARGGGKPVDANDTFRLRSAALALTLHVMPRLMPALATRATGPLQEQALSTLAWYCEYSLIQLDLVQGEAERRGVSVLRATVASPPAAVGALAAYLAAASPYLADVSGVNLADEKVGLPTNMLRLCSSVLSNTDYVRAMGGRGGAAAALARRAARLAAAAVAQLARAPAPSATGWRTTWVASTCVLASHALRAERAALAGNERLELLLLLKPAIAHLMQDLRQQQGPPSAAHYYPLVQAVATACCLVAPGRAAAALPAETAGAAAAAAATGGAGAAQAATEGAGAGEAPPAAEGASAGEVAPAEGAGAAEAAAGRAGASDLEAPAAAPPPAAGPPPVVLVALTELQVVQLAADALLCVNAYMGDALGDGLAATCAPGAPGSLRGGEHVCFAEAMLRWAQACAAAGADAALFVAGLDAAAEHDAANGWVVAVASLQAMEATVRLSHRVPGLALLARGMGWPCSEWVGRKTDDLGAALLRLATAVARLLRPPDTSSDAAGGGLRALSLVSTSACKLVHAAPALPHAVRLPALVRAVACFEMVANVAGVWYAEGGHLDAEDEEVSLRLECLVRECCAALEFAHAVYIVIRTRSSAPGANGAAAGSPGASAPDANGAASSGADAGSPGGPDASGADGLERGCTVLCGCLAVATLRAALLLVVVHGARPALFRALDGASLIAMLIQWLLLYVVAVAAAGQGCQEEDRILISTLLSLLTSCHHSPELCGVLARGGCAAALDDLVAGMLEAEVAAAPQVAFWTRQILQTIVRQCPGLPKELRAESCAALAVRCACWQEGGIAGLVPEDWSAVADDWAAAAVDWESVQRLVSAEAAAAEDADGARGGAREAAVRRARALACRASCANLGCSRLEGVSESGLKGKRCSGCSMLRFCCSECAAAEWKAGHRRACRLLAAERRAEG
eukprot:scaffold9.g3202.t1